MLDIDFYLIYFSLLYLILYVVLYMYLLNKKKQLALYVFFLPKTILGIVSLLLIESGMFITEQGVFGYDINALHYYMLFAFSSMYFFYLFAHKINIELKQKNNFIIYSIFTLAMILFLVYLNIMNPNASRFNIFALSPLIEKFGNIFNYLYQASFLYVMLTEKRLKFHLLYSGGMVIVAILSKVQFGTFLYIMEVFFIAYIFAEVNVKELYKKNKFKISKNKLFFILLSLGFIGFIIYNKISHLGDVIYLINRLTLQVHMFWGSIVYNYTYGSVGISMTDFMSNFMSFTKQNASNPNLGLGLLMNSIGDQKTVAQFIEDNVRFSGGYPSVFILHFGIYIAFFINIGLMLAYVYFLKLKIYIIKKWNILVFMIFLKIFIPIEELIFNGDYILFNIKFFTYSMIFFVFLAILSDYKIKKVGHV